MRFGRWALVIAAALFLVPAAATCAGQSPSDDAEVNSAVLGFKVKLALLDKLGAEGLRIDVDTTGDRVVLSGQVKERASQELAKEIALGVQGVGSVDNRLTLRSAEARGSEPDTPVGDAVGSAVGKAEREVGDATLETRIKTRLFQEIGRHAFDVEVEATDGEVTLRGTLPDRARERLALSTARGTPGVKKVIDLIDT